MAPTPAGGSAFAQKLMSAFRSGIKPSMELFPLSEPTLKQLRAVKMIEPVDWKALGVPPEKISPFGDSVAIFTTPTTVVYNTDKVKPADAPRRWLDLLDPKWKGQIVTVPQGIAHKGLGVILGEPQGLDLFRKLVKDQKISFVSNPVDVTARVASGEFALGYGLQYVSFFPGAPLAIAPMEKVIGSQYKTPVLKSKSGHNAVAQVLTYFMCCTSAGKTAFYKMTALSDYDTPGTIVGDMGANGRGLTYDTDYEINDANRMSAAFSKVLEEK
jgi:ABC-type Fe3+ transport system substrate-binding protein